MHLLILGGSGRTGSPLIAQSLARGDSVTALVRNAASLTPQPRLTIVTGLPTDPSAVTAAMATPQVPDAVLIALASAAQNGGMLFASPPEPRHLMTDSFKVVADAMEGKGIRKVVVLSSFGVGSSWRNMNWVFKSIFSATSLAYAFEDHNSVEEEARKRKESLSWVIVKPARLADGSKSEVHVWGDDGVNMGAWSSINRESVAAFMLDATTKDSWVGKTPVISN
jgi:putative NADH-flavin reductase